MATSDYHFIYKKAKERRTQKGNKWDFGLCSKEEDKKKKKPMWDFKMK